MSIEKDSGKHAPDTVELAIIGSDVMRAPFKNSEHRQFGRLEKPRDIQARNASYRLNDAFTLRYARETPSKINELIPLKQNHD